MGNTGKTPELLYSRRELRTDCSLECTTDILQPDLVVAADVLSQKDVFDGNATTRFVYEAFG